ncbi:MAG: glycine/sarcosine/betaine reductase selenoprotein B family protein [Candidatus Rokuibacteriota bacterium]
MTHVRYIDKTRAYYRGEGYAKPYQWAHFDEVPFAPLAKPLAESRVGLVTTSEMVIRGREAELAHVEQDPTRPTYSLPMDTPVKDLCSRKASYDRFATTLEDVDAYLPLTHLRDLVDARRIGGLTPRFQVVQSQYSQRRTLTVDGPQILAQLREDRVDVAVLTAV